MEIQIVDGKKIVHVDESDLQQGTLIIPESVQHISAHAFSNWKGLKQILLPNSLTSIGESAFSGCTNLTHVTLSNNLTKIELAAFFGCASLIQITLPDSLTVIEELVFTECTSLAQITLPNNLNRIKSGAFLGCTSLIQIMLPRSLTFIGSAAFAKCSQLSQLTLSRHITLIDSPFAGCSSLTVHIVDVDSLYKTMRFQTHLSNIRVYCPSIDAHIKKIQTLQTEIIMQFSTICPDQLVNQISHKPKGRAIETFNLRIKANITSYLPTPELIQLKKALETLPTPDKLFDEKGMANYQARLGEILIIHVAKHTANTLKRYFDIVLLQVITRVEKERVSPPKGNTVPFEQKHLTYITLDDLINTLGKGKIPALTDNEKKALQKPGILKLIPQIIQDKLELTPPELHTKSLVTTMFNSTKNTTTTPHVTIAACPENHFKPA